MAWLLREARCQKRRRDGRVDAETEQKQEQTHRCSGHLSAPSVMAVQCSAVQRSDVGGAAIRTPRGQLARRNWLLARSRTRFRAWDALGTPQAAGHMQRSDRQWTLSGSQHQTDWRAALISRCDSVLQARSGHWISRRLPAAAAESCRDRRVSITHLHLGPWRPSLTLKHPSASRLACSLWVPYLKCHWMSRRIVLIWRNVDHRLVRNMSPFWVTSSSLPEISYLSVHKLAHRSYR